MQHVRIHERQRHTSPAGRPQPIAFHHGTLWVGSRDTNHLYAIDPKTWTVTEDIEAPGEPFGIASFAGELRVVVSIGEDGDRFVYRCVPGEGFVEAGKVPCPDHTGSQIFSDGTTLLLAQMTHQRVVTLDASGGIASEYALPTRCAGIGFGNGALHIITADEDFEDLNFATFDPSHEPAAAALIASMPSDARSLAFDGTAWWTNLRDIGEIIAFTVDR